MPREEAVTLSRESLLSCLEREPLEAALAAVAQWPPRRVVSKLIGCLYHLDERIRWHAVSALGAAVADLAQEDREAARTVVRRLMWNLNDESGGVGWGAPEALGEIMARHEGLAGEYLRIFTAYMAPGGCYLELPALQRGLMWAIGRLAQVRPGLLNEAGAPALLVPYLDAADPAVRGLSARALGLLGVEAARERLASLTDDAAAFTLYDGGKLAAVTVGDSAAAALKLIG
jgi:HEAT repeat protein